MTLKYVWKNISCTTEEIVIFKICNNYFLHLQGFAGQYKADGVTETLILQKFDSAGSLKDFITSNVHFFKVDGNSSLIAFLCSVVLTRGLTKIKGNNSITELTFLFFVFLVKDMCYLCVVGFLKNKGNFCYNLIVFNAP